jgi:hypothetical protein
MVSLYCRPGRLARGYELTCLCCAVRSTRIGLNGRIVHTPEWRGRKPKRDSRVAEFVSSRMNAISGRVSRTGRPAVASGLLAASVRHGASTHAMNELGG